MSIQKSKGSSKPNLELPNIPDKVYFTIGEVGRLCRLKPHVLRYWEQEFSQLTPAKRRGNRRYYKRNDVELIRRIRDLLYVQGFTIEGARQHLTNDVAKQKPDDKMRVAVRTTLTELEAMLLELEEVV